MIGPAPRSRRPRRSRAEVSQALIDAAAALFAERPSGHLTVRDIAARADVNPALIHRYFGTKRNLLRAAFSAAQERIATTVTEMPDVIDGAALVFHTSVTEKEFVACLARASLDGVLDDLAPESPAIAGLVRRFADERERRGSTGRHDVRVVTACLSAAAMGYALFGEFIRRGAGLADEPEERVEAQIVAALQDLARTSLTE